MDRRSRFLAACRREPVDRPPVWLMRQAGRYQASYQAVRSKVSFMELCRTPELACRVTVAAVEELGVDAAILFSDILVLLEPLGTTVHFQGGPQVHPAVRTPEDVDRLTFEGAADAVGYVYAAIEAIQAALPEDVPLLGFAGSPWTLASYLIEGGSSRHLHELKRLMYSEPQALHQLLGGLADAITAYLLRQIEAGVDAVQIFDSWGGALDRATWQTFSGDYIARILRGLRAAGVAIPRVVYVNGGGHLLEGMAALDCEVLSVDWRTPLSEVRRRVGEGHALQGNVDPAILRARPERIEAEVLACLESHGPTPGHILNLGHGITPDATVDAARALVESVKIHGPRFGAGAP